MAQTLLPPLSPTNSPAHSELLRAVGEALVLSDRLSCGSVRSGCAEGLEWLCMEAWCEVLTVASRTAVEVLPEGYRELL